jgi:hypothetical protein
MSPAISSRCSLLLRSERYRRLDAEAAIRARTDFFAAASIVTRVLALSGATPFMAALSETLERENVARARLICGGALYLTGSVERNTLDFIRFEQALVQHALDRLRGRDPQGYSAQIRIANHAIARALDPPAGRPCLAIGAFVRAARSCLCRLGRAIEFSLQSDRETLGEELARSARRAQLQRAGLGLESELERPEVLWRELELHRLQDVP